MTPDRKLTRPVPWRVTAIQTLYSQTPLLFLPLRHLLMGGISLQIWTAPESCALSGQLTFFGRFFLVSWCGPVALAGASRHGPPDVHNSTHSTTHGGVRTFSTMR